MWHVTLLCNWKAKTLSCDQLQVVLVWGQLCNLGWGLWEEASLGDHLGFPWQVMESAFSCGDLPKD